MRMAFWQGVSWWSFHVSPATSEVIGLHFSLGGRIPPSPVMEDMVGLCNREAGTSYKRLKSSNPKLAANKKLATISSELFFEAGWIGRGIHDRG
jgi:hypothetical protein